MSLFTRSSDDTAAQRSWTLGEDDLFRLSGPVGTEAANDRDDVIRAQILLNHAGAYDMERLGGPTGWAGGELVRGLRRYQRDRGLTVDGLMLPDGETIEALRQDFGDALTGHRAPTADQVEQHHDILAQHRAETDGDAPPPRTPLVMPGETLPAYVQRPSDVMSDIGEDGNIAFEAGRRVSQAVPMPRLPLGPVTGIPLTNPYSGPVTGIPLADAEQTFSGQTRLPPGVSPEMAKAGRLLEQKLGDTINLLTLPVQVMRAFTDDEPIRLPSTLLDPAIAKATKTPPSEPSGKLSDTPPSIPQEVVDEAEQLIAEEAKPWIEGFSTVDQKLIRDLLIQQINHHGPLGKPETRETDLRVVKMLVELRNKEYPELRDLFVHLHGSFPDGDAESGKEVLRQETVKHPTNKRMRSFPDVTFGHPSDEKIRGRINTVSGYFLEVTPGVNYFKPVRDEQLSYEFLVKSMIGGVAQMIPKTWKVNDDALWNQYAETACRMVLEGIRTQLIEAGYLKDTNRGHPDLPPPPPE